MNTLRQRPLKGLVTRSNHFLFIVAASLLALLAIHPRAALAQGDCADCDVSGNTFPQSVGTDFLICFERNYDTVNLIEDSGYCEVFVGSLAQAATVMITCKQFPSLNQVINLPANSSQTFVVTQNPAYHDIWVVSDETIDDRAVHVTSTNPIVCSGLDYKFETADAVMALPKSSAATDYRVMSYENSTNSSLGDSTSGEYCPSQFAVAAFDDNTTVTITPSAPTAGGHAAGAPFTVTLNADECIQVQTDPNVPGLDLTGSTVTSSGPINGGKVVVYGGNARTEIPAGFINSVLSTSRDLLLESMPPTSDWGNSFVLDAIDTDATGGKRVEGDNVRVLALNDNTSVTVNGNAWVTLNHNQFADTTIKQAWLIQGSGALLVGEMAHSATDAGLGDPFLAIVPPIAQTYNDFTFLAYPDPAFSLSNVIIAMDNNAKGTISIDGSLIPNSAPYESVTGTVNGESYSVLELGVSGGVHTLTSSVAQQRGFTILSYGLGNVVSYGYAGGSLLVPQRAIQIDYPPSSVGAKHTNVVNFRNTCYMPDYLDSAVFVPTNPKNLMFGIHPVENVATDIDRLDIGASAQIHLVANGPLGSPVSGTVKIYCHTPAQFNLEDAEMPFTLYPGADAGVNSGDAVQVVATASPNPFSTYTTLNFSMPAAGDVSIVLYNDLGQVVQNIASGEFPAGPYSIRIDKRDLANGYYTCVISSNQLNFKERVAIIASE